MCIGVDKSLINTYQLHTHIHTYVYSLLTSRFSRLLQKLVEKDKIHFLLVCLFNTYINMLHLVDYLSVMERNTRLCLALLSYRILPKELRTWCGCWWKFWKCHENLKKTNLSKSEQKYEGSSKRFSALKKKERKKNQLNNYFRNTSK